MKALFAILLSAVTFLAVAQGIPGYVTDGSGQIVKTGSGLCLHSGSYTPFNAVKGCDPVIEKTVVSQTLSSDVLFEFDKAVLTVKGKAALDALALTAQSGPVAVVGHADIIGTAKYNQALSVRRADAVAKYLAAKASDLKIVASGVGSTQPAAGTELCKGMKNFTKEVACLAPSRRVVITYVK